MKKMVEVIATDEFAAWYDDLERKLKEAVNRSVGLLEQDGVALGYPHSSAIATGSVPLRELRVQSGGKPLRVFYAFDPARDAVLLIGGDKTGDDRFYQRMVPLAERIWVEYVKENFARER
jgi:hypothetical protein